MPSEETAIMKQKNISRYYSRKLYRNEDLNLQIEGEHVLKNIWMINRKTCPSRTTYLQRNNPLIFSEKQTKKKVKLHVIGSIYISLS